MQRGDKFKLNKFARLVVSDASAAPAQQDVPAAPQYVTLTTVPPSTSANSSYSAGTGLFTAAKTAFYKTRAHVQVNFGAPPDPPLVPPVKANYAIVSLHATGAPIATAHHKSDVHSETTTAIQTISLSHGGLHNVGTQLSVVVQRGPPENVLESVNPNVKASVRFLSVESD